MRISELIELLTACLEYNGDLAIIGMVDGKTYPEIEINCPDSDSPLYLELYE